MQFKKIVQRLLLHLVDCASSPLARCDRLGWCELLDFFHVTNEFSAAINFNF